MIEENLTRKLQLPGTVKRLCLHWIKEITHYDDKSQKLSVDVFANINTPVFVMLIQVRTVKKSKDYQNSEYFKFRYLNHGFLKPV